MVLKKIAAFSLAFICSITMYSCGDTADDSGTSAAGVSAGSSSETGASKDNTDKTETNNKDEETDKAAEITPMINAGGKITVGLKSDGTVLFTGRDFTDKNPLRNAISDFTDCNYIAVSEGNYVATFSDGKIKRHYPPYNRMVNSDNIAKTEGNGYYTLIDKELKKIDCAGEYVVMLFTDGTVYSEHNSDGFDFSGWNDIADISAAADHTVGLKSDRTVVATGRPGNEEMYNVSDWTDIVEVAAGCGFTVGLKSDGTVIGVGDNLYGQLDFSDWKDIIAVAVSDNNNGGVHTLGLKSDGTVVATGDNKEGQCDVSGWSDIVAIDCGSKHSVGLKSDGTVVATGYNYNEQCNVSDWKLK